MQNRSNNNFVCFISQRAMRKHYINENSHFDKKKISIDILIIYVPGTYKLIVLNF